jgi:tetratricopeptide (TPR) repeat protein
VIKRMMWVLIGCALFGCRSSRPPPPRPPAVLQAERSALQAARLSDLQNWPAAAHAWARAVENYSLLNDRPHEAIALHNLAQAERELGQWREANEHLTQAARLNAFSGRTNDWWRNQIALVQLESASDQMNAVDQRIGSLLALTNSITEPDLRGLFLNELGQWHHRRGELAEAESELKGAAVVFTRLGDKQGNAVVAANLARLRETQGQFDVAARAWREVLPSFEELGHPAGITDALAGLGRSLTATKTELALAEDCLRRAAANYRTLRRDRDYRLARQSLAECLRAQGKQGEAEAILREPPLATSHR